MKKSLLIAAFAALAMPAFAITDGVTYEAKEGYTFENLWVNGNGTGKWASYEADGIIPSREKVAAAVPLGDKIYVSSSNKKGLNEEGQPVLLNEGLLLVFDYNTGEYLKTIELTLDGNPLSGLLCANYIDKDDFGHVYICGYIATPLSDEGVANPIKLYTVDLETGALTLACALEIDETDKSGRVDFCDVSGDLTRQEAGCVVMVTPGNSGLPMYGYAWSCEKGSDEWFGNFAGGYICAEFEESYPDNGSWGQCAQVTIIPDDEFTGSLFYIDGNNTYPAIYDSEGTLTTSFADVVEEDPENPVLTPIAAPCGAYEFSLGDDSFMVYGAEEHTATKGEANRAIIARYGTLGDMSTLQYFYRFPENTALTDGTGNAFGGRRLHVIHTNIVADANGKLAAEILTYKTGNGMGLYRLAQEGFQAGIAAPVVSTTNAPVEYFNLQGIRVENPQAGMFIRRQGNDVKKVIL